MRKRIAREVRGDQTAASPCVSTYCYYRLGEIWVKYKVGVARWTQFPPPKAGFTVARYYPLRKTDPVLTPSLFFFAVVYPLFGTASGFV